MNEKNPNKRIKENTKKKRKGKGRNELTVITKRSERKHEIGAKFINGQSRIKSY